MLTTVNRVQFIIAIALTSIPFVANSQTWNPRPGWKDSYAVDGVCYCDSNGYDHGLDTKSADTPIGPQNVVNICEAIERVLGDGPTQGRIPYNDIQCGNGPANDAADETGCPGRVDIGPDGCDQIGPRWDLATVYADTPSIDGGLDRSAWVIRANNNNNDVNRMIDGLASTRWSTGTPQLSGQMITVDLATASTFDRILLNTSASSNDYPRAYSVFVSANGSNWGAPLVTGVGDGSLTSIEFAAQTQRFVRIIQTGSNQDFWWSIHELEIFNDQGAEPQPPVATPNDTSNAHMTAIINMLLTQVILGVENLPLEENN